MASTKEQLEADIARLKRQAERLTRRQPLRMKQIDELHRLYTRIAWAERELEYIKLQKPLF